MWIKVLVVWTLLLSLGNVCLAQRVAQLGGDIKPSASGVDYPNVTFLLKNPVLNDGVVFAFSAYFRTFSAVRLQIWRPVINASVPLLFELMSQIRVVPAGTFQREDVYIESKLREQCTRVRRGDRLGLYIEEAPGSVVYTFNPTQASTLSESRPIDANATYHVGFQMIFDKLTFPYEFSLAAYIDTDLSQYSDPDSPHPTCPKGLLIPQYGIVQPPVVGDTTASVVVVTGESGDTGATGPTGEKGDKGDTGSTGLRGFTGATGPMGATGHRGLKGNAGTDGADGQTGRAGMTGFTGPRGEAGPRGFPGSPGPIGPPGKVDIVTVSPKTLQLNQEDQDSLLDHRVIIGILVWLILITLLILGILVVLLWLLYKLRRWEKAESRQQTLKNNSFLADHGLGHLASSNNKEEAWIQKMKEEAESQYKLDTIADPRRDSQAGYNNVSGYKKGDVYKGEAKDLSHRNSLGKNERYKGSGQALEGAINSIYRNLDVPKYEMKNY